MKTAVVLCVAFVALLSVASAVPAHMRTLKHGTEGRTTFREYSRTGVYRGDNPFEHALTVLRDHEEGNIAQEPVDDADTTSLVEVEATTGAEVGRVRNFCEICILVMQMKQRGQPHLCSGLNKNAYTTCIENLESLLRADKAIVYWLKNGCMHMDASGPEIVRPCPALPICSWVANLFAQPPSLVRDGVESVCPKDPKFLPTIPQEYRALVNPATQQNKADPGPTNQ